MPTPPFKPRFTRGCNRDTYARVLFLPAPPLRYHNISPAAPRRSLTSHGDGFKCCAIMNLYQNQSAPRRLEGDRKTVSSLLSHHCSFSLPPYPPTTTTTTWVCYYCSVIAPNVDGACGLSHDICAVHPCVNFTEREWGSFL